MEKSNILENRKAMILEFMESDLYVPMRIKEMAELMLVPKNEKKEFRTVIDTLINEGEILVSRRGLLKLAAPKIIGTFESHSGGFGFVIVENRDKDIFIRRDDALGAMNGDTVEVQITRERHRPEGIIVNIISRAVTDIVGIYESAGKKGTYGFVIPDDPKISDDIFILKEDSMDAVDGMKVVVRILKYGDRFHKSEGRITELIGMKDDPGVDIESVIKSHGLPQEFDSGVLKQAENVAKPVSEADMAGRKDLRDILTVTIDGEDAKDLDDAVSLSRDDDGNYDLGVHIADVSNYVQENSALDREALERGTSVYLADRVIPMLPTALSNGCCSLNEKEDRLTLSCLMKIDPKGKLIGSEICESVIHSDRRMSYNEVKDLLSGDAAEELKEECRDLLPMFKEMEKLSGILIKTREKRGAIDFDFPETKIILDEKGHVTGLEPRLSNVATKIIESFMLEANETVAEYCCFQELPFVYRTHEEPDPEKIKALRDYVVNLGFSLKISREGIHPKEIQKLLKNIGGTPEEALISRMTLRSMRQAKYTTEAIGHFGLADKYYCHFTSPIRRYPDLQIHRIIKDMLRGRMNGVRISHYDAILKNVARQSSERERRADEAEREVTKLKKVEYMLDHIGDEYEGIISGVTAHGIYVELPDTVEGMIRLSDIPDDFYVFNEIMMEARGTNGGRTFRMGDSVKVKVLAADKDLRTIDFGIILEDEDTGKEPAKKEVKKKETKKKEAKKKDTKKEIKRVRKNAVEKKRGKKAHSK
ncbi:MAG: ribonuclease R [Lachnospiraceae bacterium]|nr:ribonuclease R [Lachnospiraceae bacterium]